MAQNNPNIEGRLIKNTVIDNLVAKDVHIKEKYHAGKTQDKEYWSLKLLRRLGVIPSKSKQLTPVPEEGKTPVGKTPMSILDQAETDSD